MAYNKDMQEDKEPLFDTVDTLKICLEVYALMFGNIEVKREKHEAGLQAGLFKCNGFCRLPGEPGHALQAGPCGGRKGRGLCHRQKPMP